jgi:hypothetical protein
MPAVAPTIDRKYLPALPVNSGLWVPDGSSVEIVQGMFANSIAFASLCHIQSMDSVPGPMGPLITPIQARVAELYDQKQHIWINKYRQAMISTLSIMLLLRDCMYLPGMRGVIVTQKEDLHKDLMKRIILAYEELPPEFRVPIKNGTRLTPSGIEFEHGGWIVPVTAGSESPAVGFSPDRAIISEACEMDDEAFARLTRKFMPAIVRKPFAKIVMESTPGQAETNMHRLWLSTLRGASRFTPLHLRWFQDRRAMVFDERIHLDENDYTYRERTGLGNALSDAALRFRKITLPDFDNKDEEFENKYPPDARSGWLAQQSQVFDRAPLNALRGEAVKDPPVDHDAGCRIITPYVPGRSYLITADPANFGAVGDNSALTVWDTHTWEEVAFWEGREQPDKFYERLVQVAKAYGHEQILDDESVSIVQVAIESNAAAVLGAAVFDGKLSLYHDDDDKPGWNASTKTIQEAEADTNTMLRDKSLRVRSLSLIDQLSMFDGRKRDRRVIRNDGTQSHYDRARTAIMAAHIFKRRRFRPPLTTEEVEAVEAKRRGEEARRVFEAKMRRIYGSHRPRKSTDPLESWVPPINIF